jgi:hypothetical protein
MLSMRLLLAFSFRAPPLVGARFLSSKSVLLCPSDFSAVLPYVVFRLKLGNSGPRVDGLGKALRGFFKKTIHRALGTHTNGVKLIVVQLAKLGGTQKRQAQI